MRRIVLIVLILIFFLLASLFSGSAISDNRTGTIFDYRDDYIAPATLDEGPWWKNWARDGNRNGIDDLIDEKISTGSEERIAIYLKYGRDLKETDAENVEAFDLELGYVFDFIRTISARNVDLKDIPELSALPGVGMIELQLPLEPHLIISNPAIKARNSTEYSPNTAWALGYSGKGVNIGILDTGVDDFHESLFGRFVAGVSFGHPNTPRDGSFNPDDEFGHGTYCAGIALGTGGTTDLDLDGEADYMGVAPNAGLIDVQIAQGLTGTPDAVVASILWCINNKDTDWPDQPDEYDGIDVISLSLRLGESEGEAASEAAKAGIIVATSAGNDGPNNNPPSVNAWPDEVIVVGAIDDQDTVNRTDDVIADMSSRGPRADGALKPDVCAPGISIMAPTRDSYKRYGLPTGIPESGTSFSSPHVAGVVALMLEAAPNLTPAEVMDILHESSEARGEPYYPEQSDKYNNSYGWGIVDACAAVRLAQQYDDRPPIITHVNHDVSGNTVTINWHTHKAANSIIEYGVTGGSLDQKVEELDEYKFDHTMIIKDLEQDTNYSYRISGYDEQGNGPGQSGIYVFETPTLPDTTPPKILNISAYPSYSTCTIMWDTDEDADSIVEYGDGPELGLLKKTEGEFGKKHTVTLSNLDSGTTYYFRVNSTDASNNTNHSIVANFVTTNEPPPPPEITEGPEVVDKTENSATIEWKTNKPTNSVLRYRAESEEWKPPIPEPEDEYQIDHSIPITGLSPSTQYYYKIEFEDSEGNSDEYTDGSFITKGPPDLTPPEIDSGPDVIIVTDTTATIVWTTNEESDSLIRYGITEGPPYEKDWPPDGPTDEYVTVHNLTITGLDPNQLYHYQVESRDTSPNKNPATSGDNEFTTKPKPDLKKPKIISGPTVLVVGEDTATIVWTTDEDSDSVVHYGTDESYGHTAKDSTLIMGHEITLIDLIPFTTYHFRVESTDAAGNTQESQDNEFTTLDIIIPIDIEFLNIANGEIIKGVKTVDARITGGEGLIIHGVRYKIDDSAWENLGSGSTFSITIDSETLEEGEHTLYVEVTVGKLSKEVTMQEDVTFVVEHEKVDNSSLFLGIGLAIAIILVIGAVIYIRNSAVRRRKERAEAAALRPIEGSPFTPVDFSTDTDIGFGFIPDEEPVTVADIGEDISFVPDIGMEDTILGISFVPDAPALMEEPGISFVPDMASVSFDAFAEEPEPVHSPLDKVRCPKCRRTFETDLSSDIACPHCGFSAGVKTW